MVVVGGGLAGLATAHALTCAGLDDVLVLEREATCGYHASGRNAAPGRQLTEDDAVTALTMRGAAFLRNPPAGFAETRLWAQTGSVLLVDRAEELERLCTRACEALGIGGAERTGYLLSGCDEAEVAPCDAVPTPGAREALAEELAPLRRAWPRSASRAAGPACARSRPIAGP